MNISNEFKNKKILIENKFLKSQIIRFFIVGVVNTAFSYFIYSVGLFFSLHYTIASLIALISGILFGFKTHGTLVFSNHDNRRLFHYFFSWFLIYFFNIAIIGVIVNTGFSALIAGAVALIPVTVISFLIQKFFVFRTAHLK
jgi:putative flippase GtrA